MVCPGELLKKARLQFGYDLDPDTMAKARAALKQRGLVGKSRDRDRRQTAGELEALSNYFSQDCPWSMPMADIMRFQIGTALRISKTCNLKWTDLDKGKRTIIVRDRKHPASE